MPDLQAAQDAAPAPAGTDTCPVCALVVSVPDPDDDVGCPRCGLVVHTGPQLGPVTDELRGRLDEQREAAIRRLDALAAVRAAGYPGSEDHARLLRLARLTDGPPLTEPELDHARSVAAESPPGKTPGSGDPRQAALSALAGGAAAEAVVVLVGRHGLALRIFVAEGDQGDPGASAEESLVERATAARWSWPQVLDGVPEDKDAELFWLAGRVGPDAPSPRRVAEAARRWAEREAGGWPAAAMIRQDPGWAVPDTFAGSLTGALATATRRAVPGLVLAPRGAAASRPTDEWSVPAPARGTAWGMAPGYPEPGQVTVMVGAADGNVAVLLAGADTEPRTALRLGALVTAVAAAADTILAGSVLGEVCWVAGRGRGPVSLPPHSGRVSAVAVGPRMLLSLGSEGRLHRVRLGSGGPDPLAMDIVEVGPSGAEVLAVAERAPVAVTGGTDGILRVIDTERLSRRDVRLSAQITALALDPDGRLAVAGCGDGGVAVVALADGTSRRLFAVADPPAGPLAVSRAGPGASVVAADATGLLTAWSGGLFSGDDGTIRLGRHVSGVGVVRHLMPASVLAMGQRDGVLRTWPLPHANRLERPTTGEV